VIAVGRLLRQCIPLGVPQGTESSASPDVMAVRRSSLKLDLASALLPVAERAADPDPQNRYPSAHAMRVDMERLGPVTNARESLARFVQHAFEVPHRERRAHIQELLAERAILQSNVTAPHLADQEVGATPLDSRRPSTPAPTPYPSPPYPSSLHAYDAAPVQTRKRQKLVLGALGVLGVLVGLLWFLGRGSELITPAQAAVASWANRTTGSTSPAAEAAAARQQPATPSVTLRLCGSNTLGSELIPELSRAFLEKKTGKAPTQRPSLEPQESAFVSNLEGTDVGIEIHAHGSSTAFKGLEAEQCDIGMASRGVEDGEAEALMIKGLGDIRNAGSEHVIALDGIAVIVHPGNPLRSVDRETLKKIYTGAIRDWSELGGTPGPITVLARDNKSGTYDTFKHLVLGSDPLLGSAQRYEDSAALADSVASDPTAIGFAGFAHTRSAKALAIGEPGVAPMLPTRFTVSTEGYLLARRLFLYTLPKPKQAWSTEFVSFVLSHRGQDIVAKHHFVDLNISALDVPCESHCKDRYGYTVAHAKRLSLDFRFRPGSNEPDSRAELDLDRLIAFLGEQHPNAKVLLLGFSDAGGRTSTNEHLSLLRAQAIAHALTTRGVHPEVVVGFGAKNPVAANTTEDGRKRNRRVEVWIRDTEHKSL
jgi:phosphate transport system substrate-binding protein